MRPRGNEGLKFAFLMKPRNLTFRKSAKFAFRRVKGLRIRTGKARLRGRVEEDNEDAGVMRSCCVCGVCVCLSVCVW